MDKANGFTLVELMIVIAMVGIVLAIAIPQYQKYKDPYAYEKNKRAMSMDVRTPKSIDECIGGYKFVFDKEGNPIQIIGSNGHGVECYK